MDDSSNLIRLYSKTISDLPSDNLKPIFKRSPIQTLQTNFNKLRDHCHTGIKSTYNTFSQQYYVPFLRYGFPSLYMTS